MEKGAIREWSPNSPFLIIPFPGDDEVYLVFKRQKTNNAPGVDGIPTELFKRAHESFTQGQILYKTLEKKIYNQNFFYRSLVFNSISI